MKNARPTGAAHPRWNPGPILSSHGYVKVRVGKGHPLADSKGFCYAHKLVWYSAGRRMPRRGEALHHKSGDKSDNRLANLTVITVSKHAQLHAKSRARTKLGTFKRERATSRRAA